MGRYVAWRIAHVVPVLLGVSVIVFVLIRFIPGDPAVTMLGDRATPSLVSQMHHQMGLDRPIWVQYAKFLDRSVHADFGSSFIYRRAAWPVTIERLPISFALIFYALLFACLITVPLATLAATRRGSLIDHGVRLVATGTLGLPSFWLGLMLALYLGARHHIFPVGGEGNGFLGTLWHLTLPAFTIGLSMSPILVRSLRNSLIEVLAADYIVTARAMGLGRWTVFRSYLLKNAVLPVVLILSIHIGWLLSGTVVIEQIFGIPGVGSLLINSIATRDYAFIQLVTLIFALIVIVVNLMTDVFYGLIDPRVSFGR